MPKQTVEEAATAFSEKVRNSPRALKTAQALGAKEGFYAGSAWQKEQGIDWIGLAEGLPQPKGNEKHIGVIITDGRYTRCCAYWFESKTFATTLDVTHWALINLPKTD
jgi:hypothetical protein